MVLDLVVEDWAVPVRLARHRDEASAFRIPSRSSLSHTVLVSKQFTSTIGFDDHARSAALMLFSACVDACKQLSLVKPVGCSVIAWLVCEGFDVERKRKAQIRVPMSADQSREAICDVSGKLLDGVWVVFKAFYMMVESAVVARTTSAPNGPSCVVVARLTAEIVLCRIISSLVLSSPSPSQTHSLVATNARGSVIKHKPPII